MADQVWTWPSATLDSSLGCDTAEPASHGVLPQRLWRKSEPLHRASGCSTSTETSKWLVQKGG